MCYDDHHDFDYALADYEERTKEYCDDCDELYPLNCLYDVHGRLLCVNCAERAEEDYAEQEDEDDD